MHEIKITGTTCALLGAMLVRSSVKSHISCFLLVLWTFLGFAGTVYASGFLEEVSYSHEVQVRQGRAQCFPTSLFYLLKMGNPQLKSIYEALPGSSDESKLQSLIHFGESTTSPEGGHTLFDSRKGVTLLQDQLPWMQTLAESFHQGTLPYTQVLAHRKKEETRAGVFLKRIHGLLLNSLQKQSPVLIAIEHQMVKFEDKQSRHDFGHAVLIIGVQRDLLESDLGFAIKYMDPLTGRAHMAFISEEIREPFNAYIYELTTQGLARNWSQGQYAVLNNSEKWVSSPYLKIQAPSLSPPTPWPWEAKLNIYLQNMLVRVGAPL